MKTVQITFTGPRSDDLARRFFHFLVDGGLEDQVIQGVSGHGATLEIGDCNNEDLAIHFQCREEKTGRSARKGVKA